MHAAEISRSALDVERKRLEVIAENFANANSARVANGTLYQTQHLVSGPRTGFETYLHGDKTGAAAKAAAGNPDLQGLSGVAVYGVQTDSAPPRLVHEPGNPQADKNGFVAYPNIDQAEQMTLMMKTERAYEANLVMLNIAHQMYGKALELGKHSS